MVGLVQPQLHRVEALAEGELRDPEVGPGCDGLALFGCEGEAGGHSTGCVLGVKMHREVIVLVLVFGEHGYLLVEFDRVHTDCFARR